MAEVPYAEPTEAEVYFRIYHEDGVTYHRRGIKIRPEMHLHEGDTLDLALHITIGPDALLTIVNTDGTTLTPKDQP